MSNAPCRFSNGMADLRSLPSDSLRLVRPSPPDDWRGQFREHFQEKRSAQEAYDRARICTLAFSADELGAFTVRCERAFTPLRWAVRRHGHGHVLRLYDDRGRPELPLVSRAAFETPCVEEHSHSTLSIKSRLLAECTSREQKV